MTQSLLVGRIVALKADRQEAEYRVLSHEGVECILEDISPSSAHYCELRAAMARELIVIHRL